MTANQLQLYYLNQIGIVPWIQRLQQDQVRLLILIPERISPKEHALLKQIKSYINLPAAEVSVQIHSGQFVKKQQSQLVLTFGIDDFDPDDKVFCSFSLQHFLDQPADKKRLMPILNELKDYLGLN